MHPHPLDDRDWLPVADCAERMHLTPDQVRQLVDAGALRGTYLWGVLHVEPAIVNTMPTTT